MKKIMFNDKCGLTEAVLQGRKTMTRRVVRLPEYWHGMWVWSFAFDKKSCSLRLYDADELLMEDPDTGECAYVNPHYKIGEVVAVAQSYKDIGYTKEWVEQHISPNPNAKPTDRFEKKYPGWSNKMFVSAKFMSHQIRITDVKAEKLQDISDEDCMREGIVRHTPFPIDKNNPRYAYNVNKQGLAFKWFGTPKNAFADLIDKVSGKGTWERNPYVFAYTFELVK